MNDMKYTVFAIFLILAMLVCFRVYLHASQKVLIERKKHLKNEYKKLAERKKEFEATRDKEYGELADRQIEFQEQMERLRNGMKGFELIESKHNSTLQKITRLEDECKRLSEYKTSLQSQCDEISENISAYKDFMRNIEDTAADYQKAKEDAWNEQIDSGYLPENISLRAENRINFFVYMNPLHIGSETHDTFVSDPFGNAKDAKMFAESLKEIFDAYIYVRQCDNYGEYQVRAENLSIKKMTEFYQRQNGKYEFLNPCFDKSAENYQVISGESKLLNAFPSSETCESGEDYEKYVASRLSASGFRNVRLTQKSSDYGADVICEKQGVKYCVQCKFYSNPVGVSAVQEIFAAKAHYNSDRAMVITNNTFTSQAKKLAGDNGVILVDSFT